MVYEAREERYATMRYRRSGMSGLKLPVLSIGLWQNFGSDAARNADMDEQRRMLTYAFDHGITHFDLANNYGPPAGSAEENFGEHLASTFAPYRDELVISTKAGYDMWPGPYGSWGSRKNLTASLDQSLKRMGLDYVDIFYSHRLDPETPLDETMGALHSAVQSGKALYVGISNYPPAAAEEAAAILEELGTPLLIHQPSYSMFNRRIEDPESPLLDTLEQLGAGCIVFSPLFQGLLTDKYLEGVPRGSRVKKTGTLKPDKFTHDVISRARKLNAIAQSRGQRLSQMALAWVLRDPRVTSALFGASSLEQLKQNLAAADNLEFSPEELASIDALIVEPGETL